MIKRILDYIGLLLLIIIAYVFFSWAYEFYSLKKLVLKANDTDIIEKNAKDHINNTFSEISPSKENYEDYLNSNVDGILASEKNSFLESQLIVEKSYNYFNEIRARAGMIELELNEKLEKSAQHHSDYLARYSTKLRYFSPHKELENTEGFRGESAGDRAIYAGYKDYTVNEGLSIGNKSYIVYAINGLMTAIYHRFDVLTFDKDEIGIGLTIKNDWSAGSNYIHNLGNSNIAKLCDEENDILKQYHYGVCGVSYLEVYKFPGKEYLENLEESEKKGIDAITEIKEKNPEYVLWPADDSINNRLEYGGMESPSPIIDYERTGNPISIQFNDYYFSKNIKMNDFKLYKEGEEVKKVRVLTKSTDINKIFSEYEYALFPLDVLAKDTLYQVEFSYEYEETEEFISWSFKTYN